VNNLALGFTTLFQEDNTKTIRWTRAVTQSQSVKRLRSGFFVTLARVEALPSFLFEKNKFFANCEASISLVCRYFAEI
jgi:hypothetical protein